MANKDRLAKDLHLLKALAQREVIQPQRKRPNHPKGWEPGVRFTADGSQFITTSAVEELSGESQYLEAVKNMGIEIPEGHILRIVEMRFDEAAWTRDDPEQKYAVTRPVWRYRFAVVKDEQLPMIDPLEVLNSLYRRPESRRTKHKATGDGTFVLNLNDTQIGKDAGGGTEATIERLDRYFSLAAERVQELRDKAGDLVILLGGDLIEGCNIYPNQSFEIDLDRRSQIRTMTGIVLNMLDRIAPEYEKVRVLAVGGNHGEHRQNGKRVNRHDNDDQLVAEAAATAAERDDRLSHVAFTIAHDEPALTMDIQGNILALTHGNVYGKMSGASPAQKAYNWFKNMAAGKYPAGDANILVGNHFHHEIITNFGSLLFVQNPAMDGGSPTFADYSGTDCPPGMATWLMTREERLTGYEILR